MASKSNGLAEHTCESKQCNERDRFGHRHEQADRGHGKQRKPKTGDHKNAGRYSNNENDRNDFRKGWEVQDRSVWQADQLSVEHHRNISWPTYLTIRPCRFPIWGEVVVRERPNPFLKCNGEFKPCKI